MNEIGQSKEVKSFIQDIFDIDYTKAEIVVDLYKLFESHNNDFTDKFIYGGIGIYLGKELIGGIWVSKHHVSLTFSDGYMMEDRYKLLEGSGKFRRHIKVKGIDDVELKYCSYYIERLFKLYS